MRRKNEDGQWGISENGIYTFVDTQPRTYLGRMLDHEFVPSSRCEHWFNLVVGD